MIYYRLLRDNKESGPYSEEDMIAHGFKPYDLLWAEGKSAGWQYPSEIPAFRPYAPIIEEQPFDRFYKKKPADSIPPVQKTAPVYRNFSTGTADSGQLTDRHIHVTLPSGNTVNLTTLVAARDQQPRPAARELKEPISPAPDLAQVNPAGEVRVAVRPERGFLSGIATEQPVATAVPGRYPPPVTGNNPAPPPFSWTMILGAVTGIAGLVGLGIMIGLSLNTSKTESTFNAGLASTAKTAPASSTTGTVITTIAAEIPGAAHSTSPEIAKLPVTTEKPGTSSPRKNIMQRPAGLLTPDPKPATDASSTAAANNHSDQERMVQRRDDAILPVKSVSRPATAAPLHLEKSLQLSVNDFKTGAFGGISHLRCTLSNTSPVTIDAVTVEVTYIQANNKTFKTENVVFKNIPAGGQLTIDAPESPRGVKISARVIKVEPREALPNTTAKS